MITDLCTECRSRAVVQGFMLKRRGKIIRWCQSCLTTNAERQVVYASSRLPKLRQTNIKKYNEVINSDLFIEYLNKENKKSATSWRFHTKYV